MKNPILSKNKPFSLMLMVLSYISLCSLQLTAQSGTYPAKDFYEDYYIPNDASGYLALTAVGGGGGVVRFDNLTKDVKIAAGEGAYVKAWFEIGTGENQLKPGSVLRFMVGGRGADFHSAVNSGGGGGGGTGIAYQDFLTHEWELLVVAGGGGGSTYNMVRLGVEGDGGIAYVTGNEGSGEGQWSDIESTSGAGAYVGDLSGTLSLVSGKYVEAGWPDRKGAPTGGRSLEEHVKGGWGFGAGGDGSRSTAQSGGGGGFSGGFPGSPSAIYSEESTGGTSYVNEGFALSFFSVDGKRSTTTHAGHAGFEYTDHIALPTIKLAKDPNKCLNVRDGKAVPGTNVQLWDCNGGTAENWVFTGSMVKFAKDHNQCLEIQGSTPNNGANVELWTCNTGTNAQKWIYDGVKRLIRSARNLDKCLDLKSGNTANGTNIQLYTCQTGGSQQWIIDEATISPTSDRVQSIRTSLNTDKCLHIKDGDPVNSANIELWDCMSSIPQQWYFVGSQIKANGNTDKCMDASGGGSGNGTNLILWDCNGQTNQQWIYDGITQTIRSGMNLNKCIHLKEGSTANGANAELWDCTGSKAQQFNIQGPCDAVNDKIPPVAKCKEVVETDGMTIPYPELIDDGSYDNCSISSMHVKNVSVAHYQLTVIDANGNSSSCISRVY